MKSGVYFSTEGKKLSEVIDGNGKIMEKLIVEYAEDGENLPKEEIQYIEIDCKNGKQEVVQFVESNRI